jgi:hypothetical protein
MSDSLPLLRSFLLANGKPEGVEECAQARTASDAIHCLEWLNLVPVDTNRQGLLYWLDRNNQTTAIIAGDQNSFDTIEAPAADADSLPDFEERITGAGDVLEQAMNVLDLCIRDRGSFALDSHKADHAIHSEHSYAFLRGWNYANKCVSRKQRKLHCFPSVAPTMYVRDQRQKCVYAASRKLRRDHLLVPATSLNGVPVRTLGDVQWG